MIIIGAGLSGCLAAILNPEATVIEAGAGESEHQAVLRFREPQIGRAIGIPFREIRVYKSAWFSGRHWTEADPRLMNLYSRKVAEGRIVDRSIADLRPVTRWVASPDLHKRMLSMLSNRVRFNSRVVAIDRDAVRFADDTMSARLRSPLISTMPLPALLRAVGVAHEQTFTHAPINVTRWYIPGCDVHQTVYFPERDTPLYRATLTGENLIAETVGVLPPSTTLWMQVSEAFGLGGVHPTFVLQQTQRYGKILPVDVAWRKRTLYRLTAEFNIYSLGRFALWSNVLLDDVYADLAKIRNMISLTTEYDLLKTHAQEHVV